MIKKTAAVLFLTAFILAPPLEVSAQDSGIKVVPIGETIQPEKKPKRRRRRAPSSRVKAGTSFIVETATALSTGLTEEGETVYIKSGEDVGLSSRPAISVGAPGRGTVSMVDDKEKTLTVKLESIESSSGEQVRINGEIKLTAEDGHAAASVGERFTATLAEDVTGSRASKKNEEAGPELIGFVEIDGKGARADLKKGKAKGKVRLIVEPPKGFTADDIDTSSIALHKVNGFELLSPVYADARKPKQGDKNKNGTSDWTMYFKTWEFIRNQPRGTNTVHITGTLKGGKKFDSTTRVMVGY